MNFNKIDQSGSKPPARQEEDIAEMSIDVTQRSPDTLSGTAAGAAVPPSSDSKEHVSNCWSDGGRLGDDERSDEAPISNNASVCVKQENGVFEKRLSAPQLGGIFVDGIEMRSIEAAIDYVETIGSIGEISVQPGVYKFHKRLPIIFPVTITGKGNPSGDPVVFMSENKGFFILEFLVGSSYSNISNIVFSREVKMLGHGTHTSFNNCTFESTLCDSIINVFVGDHASPTMNQCHFKDRNTGIVFDKAKGTLTRCQFEARGSGVILRNGSSPVFSECSFSETSSFGAYVEESSGRFERCQFMSKVGMKLAEYADPVVTNCVFTASSIAMRDSNGSFTKNKMIDSSVGIKHSNPLFHRNSVKGSGAIRITNGAEPALIENVISQLHGGIYVEKHSKASIRENLFLDMEHHIIFDNAGGVIEHNEMSGCKFRAIRLVFPDAVTIANNRIINASVGIDIVAASAGTVIENNTISNVTGNAIQISDANNVKIERNVISHAQVGIYCARGSSLFEISHNDIYNCNLYNVLIAWKANGIISRNKIYNSKYDGIAVWSRKEVRIENNNITSNKRDGISVQNNCVARIESNTISMNGAFGVEIAGTNDVALMVNSMDGNSYGQYNFYQPNKLDDEKPCFVAFTLMKNSMERKFPINGEMYTCATCDPHRTMRFCDPCRMVCHRAHDTQFVDFDEFHCSCGEEKMRNPCCFSNLRMVNAEDTARNSVTPKEGEHN